MVLWSISATHKAMRMMQSAPYDRAWLSLRPFATSGRPSHSKFASALPPGWSWLVV